MSAALAADHGIHSHGAVHQGKEFHTNGGEGGVHRDIGPQNGKGGNG